MGNSNTNPSVSYRTKDGIEISYVFWDMKGKQRFPPQPGDSEIEFMLSRCLQQIDADPIQIKTIKEFSPKYKYRFTVLHKRKVSEAKKERQYEQLRRSTVNFQHSELLKQSDEKSKVTELQQLMKDVQLNETMIKVALMKIDKYISDKQAQTQFISIRGFERLLQLLDKAIRINAAGTKTNFSNQIQLLKFFKMFSDRYPKEFYNHIPNIRNYGSVIIKAYHPVNTHITAYCLSLLTDYFWRVEQGDPIIKILQSYRLEQNYESLLSPFANTINETDNILMAFYNIKFINELIASAIEEDQRQILKQNLTFVKYGYVLDGIKAKLEQNYFNLDNTTFISMHQKIFKYATKDNKSERKLFQENRVSFRNTLNLNLLHEQILLKMLDIDTHEQQNEDSADEILIVFLAESDRKKFNKFILDTLALLQNYNNLEYQLQNYRQNGEFLQQTQQMVESKIHMQNVENYFTRIKQSCTKNNCNEIMINCLKNLAYFEKNQWKHLERFILQELTLEKRIMDEVQELKKNLDQKETMVKRIIKENIDLRNQLAELRMKDGQHSERNVGKLSQESKQYFQIQMNKINQSLEEIPLSKKTLLPPPPSNNLKEKKASLQQMPNPINRFVSNTTELPLPPNMTKKKQESDKYEKPMRDRPKLNIQSKSVALAIEPSKVLNQISNQNVSATQLNNKIGGVQSSILLPPPSLGKTILPPPPNLGSNILPPPPSLGSTSLPPPPSLGSTILPPPPSLGQTILPPPPSLGSTILPLPSLSSAILPPPPSLNSSILPPPPTLGSTILPPPPTLGSSILPPPPSLSPSLLPPPPSLGSTILPPPPSLGATILPPPPTLGGILPPPPLIGAVSNLPMPGFGVIGQTMQKMKQKRKPKVPLKVCNYTVIQYEKTLGTIFEQIDDTQLEFNENQLVQLFQKVVPSNKSQQPSKQVKSLIMFPPTKQPVKLIGSDRWRNAEIILTKLKIQPGEVTKTLTGCTGKFTAHSNLESILKIAPNEQEEQMIKTYQGNLQDLAKPQKFLKQLIQIPQYSSRIKAMIFSSIKEEFYYQLSSKIQQLTAAFTSLKQNKRLKYVLLICLGIGNYLNGTTLKGGAWGFKIQTIQRLQEVKSNDNKMNAAFYLVKQVWKQYPYPIFQKDEIQLYQYISKMPLSQISQQVGQLNLYFKAVQKAFKSHDKNNPNDCIGPYCEELFTELSVKLQQYKVSSQKLNQLYLECAKYYCEDGQKIVSDEFGKKMFQCILFVSNTQKMFKVIQEKRIKEEGRKAVKNQISYVEPPNPESIKKGQKKISSQIIEAKRADPIKLLPEPPKLSSLPLPPLPPKPIVNKQEELKKIEKIQQQREKKALQEIMMRRTSKLQAYRMSKMGQVSSKKGGIEQIDFLKGIK